MDPAACREKLSRILEEECGALEALCALLDKEHALLLANDVAALDEMSGERRHTVGRIVRVDGDRRELCLELGRSNDAAGLQQLLHWCDPYLSLSSRFTRRETAAERCRERNDRNGALVGARLQHVQARLAVLLNDRRHPVTYGPRGAYRPENSGRVLSAEA